MSRGEMWAVLDELVARMGFELVTFEKGGGHRRPLLRLRIDRPHGEPGRSTVTADDCARVAREVRDFLEGRAEAPADFALEVSSPGVERPLVRRRDYRRFAGRDVLLKGYAPLAGRSKKLEGTLLGLEEREDAEDPDGSDRVELEVSGERLRVPLSEIAKATLVYRWEEDL